MPHYASLCLTMYVDMYVCMNRCTNSINIFSFGSSPLPFKRRPALSYFSCLTSYQRITTARLMEWEAGVVLALALMDDNMKLVTKATAAEAWPVSTGLLDNAFNSTSQVVLV